jgi:predicted transcriptional regulator
MSLTTLSRRERQIMDILYRQGKASALDVQKALPDPPSYSAVRAMLRTLEEKGHIRHEADGLKFIYMPVENRNKVRRSTIRHVLGTIFGGSPEQIVATLLDVSAKTLSKEELDRMAEMIEKARKESKS